MSDDSSNEQSPRSKSNWFRTLLFVAAAALFFSWFLQELMNPVFLETPHPSVGKPAPPLIAEGWLNGPAPTEGDLAGKVYVVEAWAFWCGPCLQAAPHMVELREQLKDQDVIFIGLTGEGSKTLRQTRRFITQAKIAWPCGYGAVETLRELYQSDEMPIPMAWDIDQQGLIIWAGHPMDLTEAIINNLLTSSKDAAAKRR